MDVDGCGARFAKGGLLNHRDPAMAHHPRAGDDRVST
jgi:hypothetical protein